MSDAQRFKPGGVIPRGHDLVVMPGELVPQAYLTLEAIVRDLAANEPLVGVEGMGSQVDVCGCCDATEETWPARDPVPLRHADTCPYRRAVEWVAEHPASERGE